MIDPFALYWLNLVIYGLAGYAVADIMVRLFECIRRK